MSPHGRPVIKQRSVWICAPYLCNLNTVTSPVLHHISAVGAEWSNVMWARRIYPLDPPVHMNWHTSIFSSVNHTMGIIRTENQSNGLYVVLIFYCYAVNLSNKNTTALYHFPHYTISAKNCGNSFEKKKQAVMRSWFCFVFCLFWSFEMWYFWCSLL